ncbi:DUF1861 family protein [Anaerobranca gottschalkii]|uniref:DUF1861 family protein n=1 Tax=Anaerobranca gottschalkii DSM 13577 TaxID=1120990 RepID=A0A1H9YHI0_9FIRM|nr:DUF1861 family protein [Anaerobranca gottschalkii]SES68399.1 Protein of unknown function [Anaerobranca gottschalkii DSM 13577]
MFWNSKAESVDELLNKYHIKNTTYKSERLIFEVKDDRDIYNITAPFDNEGESIIAGRVEKRDSENSEVMFFINRGNKWTPKEGSPVFNLQDPFITKIKNQLIFGGVEVYPTENDSLGYRTVFYRGANINSLEKFTVGPDMMKDIRLLELKDGRILVFTRPQGEIGGRGTIGYIIINSLEELTPQKILEARLFKNQFIKEEWGGANELINLNNGLVGVLGHIAKFDNEGNRHYYSMTFAFNPINGEITKMKIIATRSDFADGEYKRPDLKDVIFSGGILRKDNGKAELYCGVSDAEAHKVMIEDPFLEYEKIKI